DPSGGGHALWRRESTALLAALFGDSNPDFYGGRVDLAGQTATGAGRIAAGYPALAALPSGGLFLAYTRTQVTNFQGQVTTPAKVLYRTAATMSALPGAADVQVFAASGTAQVT